MRNLLKVGSALMALACGSIAQAVTFDYSNVVGSAIVFDGAGNFTFTGGKNFEITTGDATGLLGTISGSFAIGAGVNQATVTGAGSFSIDDGAGSWFTADLAWVNISRTGTIGGLNFNGAVNLSNFSYSGSDATLLSLLADGGAVNTLTFQFAGSGNLDSLRNVAQRTSFSGTVTSVSVPDGGVTAALLGLALVGLSVAARRRV